MNQIIAQGEHEDVYSIFSSTNDSSVYKLGGILSITLLLISNIGWASIYYVNDSDLTGDIFTTAVGNDSNNGTSPSSPKATLSNVILTYGGSFTSGDTIYVDAGTYFMTDANLALGPLFSGVSIIGAGSSLTFFDNNSSSTDANRWANISGSNIHIEGIFLTGYNYGFGGASTLNFAGATNVTVTDVQVNENSSGGGATAIVISGGSIIDFIGGGSNCNPFNSSVAGGGVNIEGNGNIVSFTNYSITGNKKALQGGSGIYISGDNSTFVTITNSRIADNVTTSADGGAGVYLSGANLSITGSCIEGNLTHSGSGPKYGGAISLTRGATLTASNCTFSNNTVSNSGKGGALSINTSLPGSGSAALATFTSCNFDGNTASSEGNHIYLRVGSSNPASVIIDECTFSSTSQDVRQDNSGTVTVTNSGSALTLSGTNITTNNLNPTTTAITNCPIQVIPCFSLLPVELVDFHAECRQDTPYIEWTTASEIANDYFVLERINMHGSSTYVTTIEGHGNSQSAITYSFLDHHAPNETNYYRLTQVDFNGNRQSFDVIALENCSTERSTIVHYSSETSELYLFNSQGSLDNLSTVSLISTVGKKVFMSETISKSGSHYVIPVQTPLSAGNYLVLLHFNDHDEIVKLFVH